MILHDLACIPITRDNSWQIQTSCHRPHGGSPVRSFWPGPFWSSANRWRLPILLAECMGYKETRLYEGPTYWWRDEGLKESRQMIDHLIYNLDILQCFNKETMFHINSTILHLSKERNVTWSRWKAICCFYPLAWIVGTHLTKRHKLTTWARED